MDVDSALTAAMRWRQRRLRQFLRHERLSVAMALAEKLHHTSRGQRFARAGEEGRKEHYALRRQRPPPPQPELFQLYEEEPGGSRPACLGLRRRFSGTPWSSSPTSFPWCRFWTLLGCWGEVGVVDFFRELDAPALDELVIAVPKFYLPWIPKRCPRRRPRRAEKLVEVPTIISYSSLQQRIAEQLIDFPVLHDRGGRGGGGGLQGFSQGQASTAFRGAEFVDIPVPPGRVGGGGLQGFLPGQGSAASSSHVGSAEEAGYGVFRTFSRPEKSAEMGPHSGSELSADFTQSASGRWYLDRDPSIWWDAPGWRGGGGWGWRLRCSSWTWWSSSLLCRSSCGLVEVVVPGLQLFDQRDVLGGVLVAEGRGGGRRF